MSDVFDPSITSASAASSSSCPALGTEGAVPTKHGGGRQRQDHPPPFLTEDEVRLWAKERQKKDNHNQSMFCSLLLVPILHSTIVRSVYGQIMARFKRTVSVSVSSTITFFHCANGDEPFYAQIGFGTYSFHQCKFDGDGRWRRSVQMDLLVFKKF